MNELQVSFLLLVSLLSSGLCEDVIEDEAVVDTFVEVDIDGYAIMVFLIFFALCVSGLGVFLFYFSWMEATLMWAYSDQGHRVQSEVIRVELTRGLRPVRPGCSADNNTVSELEYVACVHYKSVDKETSDITHIRKLVKAMESDFLVEEIPKSVHVHVDLSDTELSNDLQILDDARRYLSVVILPGFPRSGLPLEHVRRACKLSYRLPTFALILSTFFMTALCLYISAAALPFDDDVESRLHQMLPSMGITLLLYLAEAVLLPFCLIGFIRRTLEEEYLDGGEMLVTPGDETLTTAKSMDTWL